jgi:chemotaxis protein CheD
MIPLFQKTIVVGIGDLAVSNDIEASLATYSLGSCLGVTIYDPVRRVGGLLHLMLPDSSIDPVKAQQAPGAFVDTGVPLLFRSAYELGAKKQRIVLKVFGGAQLMDDEKLFNIGRRNYEALVELLDRNRVVIRVQCIGGQTSRTVRLDLASGAVTIKSPGSKDQCL